MGESVVVNGNPGGSERVAPLEIAGPLLNIWSRGSNPNQPRETEPQTHHIQLQISLLLMLVRHSVTLSTANEAFHSYRHLYLFTTGPLATVSESECLE